MGVRLSETDIPGVKFAAHFVLPIELVRLKDRPPIRMRPHPKKKGSCSDRKDGTRAGSLPRTSEAVGENRIDVTVPVRPGRDFVEACRPPVASRRAVTYQRSQSCFARSNDIGTTVNPTLN